MAFDNSVWTRVSRVWFVFLSTGVFLASQSQAEPLFGDVNCEQVTHVLDIQLNTPTPCARCLEQGTLILLHFCSLTLPPRTPHY